MGKAIPMQSSTTAHSPEAWSGLTLGNLLSLVDLRGLGLQKLITLRAKAEDGSAGNSQLGHLDQNLMGDDGGILVLCKGIGVVDCVVCQSQWTAEFGGVTSKLWCRTNQLPWSP